MAGGSGGMAAPGVAAVATSPGGVVGGARGPVGGARGAAVVAAPTGVGRGTTAPAIPPVAGGFRGVAPTGLSTGLNGPRPAFSGGGGRYGYVPITAGARPVGTVVPPTTTTATLRSPGGNRPALSTAASRPTLPSNNPAVAAASARSFRPVPPAASAYRGGNAVRNSPAGVNVPVRTHPNRPYFTGNSFNGGRRFGWSGGYGGRPYYGGSYQSPGFYGSATGTYLYPYAYGYALTPPSAASYGYYGNDLGPTVTPPYYLGGAFPYFYGSGIVGSSAVYDTNPGGYYYGATTTGTSSDADPAPVTPAPDDAGTAATPPDATAEPAAPAGASGGPNSIVEAVQEELTRRGYYAGQVDGVLGGNTAEALRRFQANHRLAPTGQVNEATLFALDLN